jgi:hypothetical protein
LASHCCMRAFKSSSGCSCCSFKGARLKGSVSEDSRWRSMVLLQQQRDEVPQQQQQHSQLSTPVRLINGAVPTSRNVPFHSRTCMHATTHC